MPHALSQIPQGFNYQAVARNTSGVPIVNQSLPVRMNIQSDSLGGTIFWQELHSSVVSNGQGVINLVIGNGTRQIASTVATLSAIDWSVTPKFLKIEIDYSGWKTMGVSRLWSVPYALIAGDLAGSVKKLAVEGETSGLEDALFEVKNKDGQTVFAVYNEGVRVYVSDGAKALKGGFAVGGFGTDKAESTKYLFVGKDSVRIYLDTNPLTKKLKGGFAVGGYDMTKGTVQDYLDVSGDSVRIYIDNNPDTKKLKGGFAVGGYDLTKGIIDNYLNVNTDASGIINPSQNRILWYPLKNAFLTGKVLIENKDSVGENSFASGYESKGKGKYSQALGFKAIARGDYSTAIGKNAEAGKANSFAFGYNALASGQNAYAIGTGTEASGEGSFAIGFIGQDSAGLATRNTLASAPWALAMGMGSQATAQGAVAIGTQNMASGLYATALGYATKATNDFASAFGLGAIANGHASTAIGNGSQANGNNSFALGYGSFANGDNSVAMGNTTLASGDHSTSMGSGSRATGGVSTAMGGSTASALFSTAMGSSTTASERASTSMGESSTASGYISTAMGIGTTASGYISTAMGNMTIASGGNSTSMGRNSIASGGASTAMGLETRAIGDNSVSMGYSTKAEGHFSTAMGSGTTAKGQFSTAMGYSTIAEGEASTAIGSVTIAKGSSSTAMGSGTISKPFALLAIGQYNDTTVSFSTSGWDLRDPVFVIGNGSSHSSRSNAFTVLKNGSTAIGHASPAQMLDVAGNACFRGVTSGTFANNLNIMSDGTLTTSTSDISLKENIFQIPDALGSLVKLRGVYFSWKNDPTGTRQMGMIAQEVEPLVPEIVFTNPVDGLKGINYSQATALLVEAIKEQQHQIESYKSENDNLKSQVQILQEEVEQIKSMLAKGDTR